MLDCIVPGIESGSPEWLEERRKCITATDVVCILGESPYDTPELFMHKKLNGLQDKDKSGLKHIKEGIRLEGVMIEWLTSNITEKYENMLMNPFCKRQDFSNNVTLSATPDCIIFKPVFKNINKLALPDNLGACIVECKYVSDKEKQYLDKHGVICMHHYIQVQMQLYTTGVDTGLYIYCNKEDDIKFIPVRINWKFINKIMPHVKDFNERMLCKKDSVDRYDNKIDIVSIHVSSPEFDKQCFEYIENKKLQSSIQKSLSYIKDSITKHIDPDYIQHLKQFDDVTLYNGDFSVNIKNTRGRVSYSELPCVRKTLKIDMQDFIGHPLQTVTIKKNNDQSSNEEYFGFGAEEVV